MHHLELSYDTASIVGQRDLVPLFAMIMTFIPNQTAPLCGRCDLLRTKTGTNCKQPVHSYLWNKIIVSTENCVPYGVLVDKSRINI